MDRRLLETAEEHVSDRVKPADAVKLARRLRRVTFFVSCNTELVTSVDEEAGTYKFLPDCYNLRVTQPQAVGYLKRLSETEERLASRKDNPLEVTIRLARYGDCLFIG